MWACTPQVVNAADRSLKGGAVAAAKEVGLPPRGPTMRTRTATAYTALSGAEDVESAMYVVRCDELRIEEVGVYTFVIHKQVACQH